MSITAINAELSTMYFIREEKFRRMSNVRHAIRMNMLGCFPHPAYSFMVRRLCSAANAPVPVKTDAADAMQRTNDGKAEKAIRAPFSGVPVL
jgi:hypothetical protein